VLQLNNFTAFETHIDKLSHSVTKGYHSMSCEPVWNRTAVAMEIILTDNSKLQQADIAS
jgi:hypothetical protein